MVIRSYAELQRMLEKERTRLEQHLKLGQAWANEHMGYGNHMADDATEAFEQAKDLSVRTTMQDTLRSVQYALAKFERGTYGICEGCGEKIDWARLEAKPEAQLCIKCAQRRSFGR